MKYLFIYYTGTYNTRFLTEKIKNRLLHEGDCADTVEITVDTPPVNTENYDVIGLGFPIYGFNSPLPFNQYLKKLTFSEGQKFFIYKNSGETMALNNAASRIPLKIMRQSGCICIGEYHFLMPYNIHFPFSENLIGHLLYHDKKLLEIMAYHLENGTGKEIESNLFLDLGAFAFSIQKLGGDINSYFYQVDPEKCILCKKCVNACPEKNITIENGQITFGHTCDMCMRCSFYCPEKAISIGMLENWRVTDYYDLESLWNHPKPLLPLSEDTPFYDSYQKTFAEIDAEYEGILTGQEEPMPESVMAF